MAETIDGVKVVRNRPLARENTPRKLDFLEDLSIGGDREDQADLFYDPVDIEADLRGRIFVLDRRDAVVRLFDPQGVFLKAIGRKGQGPGEFETPTRMEIRPDGNILVFDPSLMRITFMAADGAFIKSVVLKDSVFDIGLGKDDTLVAGFRDPQNGRVCVGIYDAQADRMIPLFCQPTYWPERLMNDVLTYDFPYFVRFALDARGRLFAGSGIAYEISVMDLTGRVELKFKKEKERIPVTGEMLERITEMTLRGPNPYVRDPYLPFFATLAIDEQERAWVQHYLPKFANRTNPETVYDIFSPEGVFLFESRIPFPIYAPLVFKNGFIYALKRTDSGYPAATRLRIKE